MYKSSRVFFIHNITPMHVGSGQDLGIVDMPIQRESHTNYPKIEGSSLKGSIREAFEKEAKNLDDEIKIHLVFGFDETNASEEAKNFFKENNQFAGALGFSDAKILLFPVKSVKGTYAYITCPYVLKRFEKDLEISIEQNDFEIPSENTITNNSKITLDDKCAVILEEYSFEVNKNEKTTNFAEYLANKTGIEEIKEKLIVLEDDVFKDFVTQFTEVITRTKIDNTTGTVKEGALFTEEYLPAETIMYSLAMASPVFAPFEDKKGLESEKEVLNYFKECPNVIQIGANATIGKGICEIITKDKNGQ